MGKMAKRKKKLEKGIESIDKQIKLYKEKIKEFSKERPWLKEYWNKQIEGFEKEKRKKEKKV